MTRKISRTLVATGPGQGDLRALPGLHPYRQETRDGPDQQLIRLHRARLRTITACPDERTAAA